tara:strand:+ start:291 stop:842 length:552 start_codon:yes stop_codon:yes gene_type:complete
MNVTLENSTLIGDDYEGNFTNFTTLTPTQTSSVNGSEDGLIVGISIMVCVGLAATCFMMIPYIVESLHNNQINRRDFRNSWCCFNNQISDVERNNRYNNSRIIAIVENKRNNSKVEIIELVKVVVADPFDATETCSICLEEIKEGDPLGSLPCGHKHFHKKCVDGWMKVSGNKSCPLCRNVSI